jgi:hypothetical protein
MAALNLQKKHMQTLLTKLRQAFPELSFVSSTTFYWSPKERVVYYADTAQNKTIATWSLLHELSHALLGHNTYSSDFELVALESAAWKRAVEIAPNYGVTIAEEHIQDCLDTYRDWLHKRSTCPTCSTHSLQTDSDTYNCINCGTKWHVTSSRFCRPYRLKTKTPQ